MITNAFCRELKTTVVDMGDLSELKNQKFADGNGDKYNFYRTMTDNFIVPGMKQTVSKNSVTQEYEVCDDMVPQGICCHGGYIFMTAYSKSGKYNAVIYVLDERKKEYITTLIMHKRLHAGGIEYAEDYLWVGDTGADDTGYLFYYSFTQIEEAIGHIMNDDTITAIDLDGFDRGYVKLGEKNKASFITTYKGYLCVGEYMKDIDNVGRLNLYNPKVLLKGIVEKQTLTTIPANANGALFCQLNGKTYMLITANRGRMINSKVHIYEVENNSLTILFKEQKIVEMPCMLEEAFSQDENIYFVFESCAKPYRSKGFGKVSAKHILGRVCAVSEKFLCE